MNWTDEEIDKLFQESASQMNVPYQDAFWTEMETLLPQEKKKKGLGWIFGGTLTSFALIVAMIFPVNPSSVKQVNGVAAGNTTAVDAQQIAVADAPLRSDIENTFQTIENQEKNQEKNFSGKSNKSLFSSKMASRTVMNRTTAGEQYANRSDVDFIAYNTFENPELSNNPRERDGTSEDPAKEGSARLTFLAMESNAPQLVPSKFAKFSPRPKKNTFYVQGGFGISQSYISGTDKNWMTSINLGAGYQYRPQGFGFSAGLNFNSSFASNLEITRRSKVYNFSSTNYEQSLAYRQLYSIELPVSLDFRKDRHIVSLGVAPTYLATTLMRFTQLQDGELSDRGVYVGQKAGMNSFGLKTGLAYQLEVAPSWNLGIQLNAQMIKQIDETQFVGNLTKIPLSGQITIRKTLR